MTWPTEPKPLVVRIAAAVAHLMDQFDLPLFEVTKIMKVYFPHWDWKKMLQEQRGK